MNKIVRASPAPILAAWSRMRALMIVWRERLSMHDADRSQLAGPLGIEGVGRFLLDDRVDLFEKGEVVGVNAVE